MWRRWCSGRRRPRPPARLSDLTSFGAAPRSPPVPSGPSGALHTCGAWCAGVWFGASSRSPARPLRRPPAPQPGPPIPRAPSTPVGPGVLMRIHIIAEPTPNFARNSPTAASSFELGSLELQRFPTLLKLLPIELRATFPVTSPRHSLVPQPGHTSAKKFALRASISVHTRKSSPSTAQTAQNQRFFACRANFFAVWPRIHSCWASFFALMGAAAVSHHLPTTSPETDDTNAGGSPPRDETTDTTASSLAHTFETADTFARTKEPNSGHFPPAKVSRVSYTPRQAPTKASPVSSDVESGLLIHSKALRRSCLLPTSHSW